jgi:hypothetical protein
MAVSPHPSVKPGKPVKPPAVAPTVGESGQPHVGYGAPHKLHVKPSHISEMSHHFAAHAGHEQHQEGPKKGAHIGRPGDENKADEPD